MTIFGISNQLLSTQNVNVARFARHVKSDFFCNFQTLCRFESPLWHSSFLIDFYPLSFKVILVLGALQLSRTVLDKYPDMLSAHLIARLLPEMKNLMYIRSLIHQCDNEGFIHNSLVPLRHYLASPGGPLKYSLEGTTRCPNKFGIGK